MYVILVVVFILGLLSGGSIGVWWTKRTQPASVFYADSHEADTLRTKATKVVHARIARRKDRIVAVARKEGRITNDGVEDLFCIGDRTAGRYLRQLTKEGRLTKVGRSGRGVYYSATEE